MSDASGRDEHPVAHRGGPSIQFPPALTDAKGRRVRPGCTVRLADGRSGEVTAWTTGTKVQVAIDLDDESDDVPGSDVADDALDDDALADDALDDLAGADAFVEIDAGELEVVPFERRDALALGVHPIEFRGEAEPRRVVVVLPVGGQDVVSRGGATAAVLPRAGEFMSRRGRDLRGNPSEPDHRQEKVDARRFGEACLAALEAVPPGERAAAVARELDAPMLRRALEETVLPETVHRLVLIGSDQADPRFDVDDTAAFAELLAHWVRGTEAERRRRVDEIELVRITRSPHRIDFVLDQVAEYLVRFGADADEIVVVQAGGTPSMSFGAVLAAINELEVPVRHVQVPYGQPVVEIGVLTGGERR